MTVCGQPSSTELYHVSNSMATHQNRVADAVIQIEGSIMRYISIYAPTIPSDRKTFIGSLRKALQDLDKTIPICLGGDWNCVLDPLIDSTNPRCVNDGGTQLQDLIDSIGLVDPFRSLYPTKLLPTNIDASHGTNRRLDRFYISKSLL